MSRRVASRKSYPCSRRSRASSVNGVKVGIVAYTYETSGADSNSVAINGNPVSSEAAALINSFNYYQLESEDYARIKQSMDDARADGAEIIVVYYHWGNEYQREPNDFQIEMAQRTADMGADIIFASHQHVLQPIEMLTASDGRQVPVYYSLGNFISNQRLETLNNRYTEQGLIGTVKLIYDKNNHRIMEKTVSILPVWVDKYGGNLKYAIVPLESGFEGNPALAASGHVARAQQALNDIHGIIAQEYFDGYTVKTSSPDNKKNDENGEQKNAA